MEKRGGLTDLVEPRAEPLFEKLRVALEESQEESVELDRRV
jgi:hypothetical protein